MQMFFAVVSALGLTVLSADATNAYTNSPLPDVPTFVELGYNYINDTFFSVHGPAGMDPAIVRKLEDAFAKSVDTPAFKDMAKKFALQPLQIRSAEYSQILEDGWPKQVQIFKDLGRINEAATQPR